MSGIVDDGVGLYTVTWDTDFANDDYAVAVAGDNYHAGAQSWAAGSVVITGNDASHNPVDVSNLCAIAIGDQA